MPLGPHQLPWTGTGIVRVDSDGVVKIFDPSTGLAVASFDTVAGVRIAGSLLLTGALNSLALKTIERYSDNFVRANTTGGQLGGGRFMPAWRLTGAGVNSAQIVGSQFVVGAVPAGNAYAYQYFGVTPSALGGTILFAANGTNQPAQNVVICGLDSGLFVNCVHVIFQQAQCLVQKRINNVSTTVGSYAYTAPCVIDGATQYPVAVAYNGASVSVSMPDGTTQNFTDSDFAALAGPWATWELSNGANIAEGRWSSIWATFANPITRNKTYKQTILGEPGLVGHYSLDNLGNESVPISTSLIDSLGLANGATVNLNGDTAVNYTAGMIVGEPNQAIVTPGNSQIIALGNQAAYQLTTGSIECWVQTTDIRSGDRAIFGKFNAWLLEMVSGVLKFRDPTGGLRDTGKFLADGQPHHLVATFISGGAGQTLIYLDGVLVLTTTCTVVNQATTVQIACAASTWQAAITIQHCALYNVVLSAAQVLSHYFAGI